MSTVDLEDGSGNDNRLNLYRPWNYLKIVTLATFLIITFVTLFMFLITVPHPTFALLDVKFYAFNLSSTSLTSSLQITISSRHADADNAGGQGFHFDQLDIYTSYRNHQITSPTIIPPTYQGQHDVNVWSPFVNGTEVPLTPDLAVYMAQDKTATMPINVKVTGQIRSKCGYVKSRYWLKVNCRAYIMFWNYNGSDVVGSAVKNPFDLEKRCRTDVGLLGLKIS